MNAKASAEWLRRHGPRVLRMPSSYCYEAGSRVGRILRKWKTDEIPKLINVVRGESSSNSLVLVLTGTGKRLAKLHDGAREGASLLHAQYVPGCEAQPQGVERRPQLLRAIAHQQRAGKQQLYCSRSILMQLGETEIRC